MITKDKLKDAVIKAFDKYPIPTTLGCTRAMMIATKAIDLKAKEVCIKLKLPENGPSFSLIRSALKQQDRDTRQACAETLFNSDKLADALLDIAKKDPVEMALDSQWAVRVARITLTECGYEAIDYGN
jgi:hypothetical protein